MANPRVYVETTIPSFFHEERTTPDIVARRDWTRIWWGEAFGRDELVTSEAVIEELAGGPPERASHWLALLRDLPRLVIEPAIAEVVQAYLQHRLMPNAPGDALHLAIASFHKCDFLVTWNCRHLANANKFGHIRRVNTMLGLFTPSLVTPLELLGGEDDPGSA